MIVPPIGRMVVAEKPNVIETAVLPAMRSFEAIANETKVTCVKNIHVGLGGLQCVELRNTVRIWC